MTGRVSVTRYAHENIHDVTLIIINIIIIIIMLASVKNDERNVFIFRYCLVRIVKWILDKIVYLLNGTNKYRTRPIIRHNA